MDETNFIRKRTLIYFRWYIVSHPDHCVRGVMIIWSWPKNSLLIGWSRSTITFCSDRQIGWNQFHWKEDSQSFPLIYSRSPRSLCTRSYDHLKLEKKYARPQYFFLHVLLFTTIHGSIGMFITRRSGVRFGWSTYRWKSYSILYAMVGHNLRHSAWKIYNSF